MSVGFELRRARERAGLSREQIAHNTKFHPNKIEALEEGAFERLPEGIYLDGIVRAYAKEVGLDAESYVERAREEAALAASDWVTPMDVDAFPHEETFAAEGAPQVPPVLSRDLDLADRARVDDLPPAPRPPVHTPSAARDEEPVRMAAVDTVGTHSPIPPPPSASDVSAPRRRGLAALALPAIALVAAVGWGAYLYQSTRPFESTQDSGIPAVTHTLPADSEAPQPETLATSAERAGGELAPPSAPPTAAPEAAAQRDGGAVDRRAAQQPTAVAPETRASAPRQAPPEPAVRAQSPSAERTPAPPARASREPAAASAPPVTAPRAPERASREPAARLAARPSSERENESNTGLDGVWTLATQVESSSVRSFQGLRLGYQLQLQQDGSRVTGVGRKVAENGRPVRGAGQTPIVVDGTVNGDRLTLYFRERGARRESAGKLILHVEDNGTMQGRFSSDAARSGGTAIARRQ
jgi:cytoskeletal protein RodZ